MTTFAVDAVEEAKTPLETVPLGSLMGDALWHAPGAQTRVIHLPGVNPLLAAVHQAFADHRPLVLSPDAIWLTLAQGLAHHIRLDAERFRGRLVRHEGRQALSVALRSPPRGDAEFQALFSEFREQLKEALGPGIPRLLSCDFSTSTDVERMAGDVVLMDAMSPYFDFVIAIWCGIPRITLTGTPEDWRAIRRRVDVIAEFDLSWWTSSLVPILDEFIRASEGNPDRGFWTELYKPRQAYGWDQMSGWVMRLFPYVAEGGRFNKRNPLLGQSHAELMRFAETRGDEDEVPGVPLKDVPAGLSNVSLHVAYEDGARETWSLEAGVLAAAVDDTGALVPRAGVVARKVVGASVAALVERLSSGHAVTHATRASPYRGPAELNALYDRVVSAKLFPGTNPWHLRPVEEHTEVVLLLGGKFPTSVTCIVDLPDGSVLALRPSHGHRRNVFLRLRSELFEHMCVSEENDELLYDDLGMPRMCTRQPAAEVPVVGTSLIALLLHALDTGGDVNGLPMLERLEDGLQPWEIRRREA
ncbi:DUF4419 domain-containing protein [Myxococcus stipitatus]|uniref:DUF4419 domain-containing protein n=1 Tax=Myxococcus stipitatus TaxID=83455 RepID=UPI001F47063E|nr:DUF4419 domain-containing protein [Myxococcus stipitatus]MCE9668943.1 DUF4419 domain-containing protein [Myxococcus stipitatus]